MKRRYVELLKAKRNKNGNKVGEDGEEGTIVTGVGVGVVERLGVRSGVCT